MSYLPASEVTDLSTTDGVARQEDKVGEMKAHIRYLAQRIDRLQQTTLAGLVANDRRSRRFRLPGLNGLAIRS